MPATPERTRVVPYAPMHRAAFRELNLEWIAAYFEVEDEDRRVLDDPEGQILAPGGAIVVALDGDVPVGTGALIPTGPHEFELAKMAVTERARGRGIGRAICLALVALARERGAHGVELLSHRSLDAALGLYHALGFVEAPLGDVPYRRANIRMVLRL
ncbi:MAG TPA: GNAT family N-acetyltransferase [Gemmatimonadales bacterium]|nr:GNAT family N-acetyltransferase [Gemmatimonadales bacterium]